MDCDYNVIRNIFKNREERLQIENNKLKMKIKSQEEMIRFQEEILLKHKIAYEYINNKGEKEIRFT